MRNVARAREGTTAVEFALIAPVFLMLTMGAVEFGAILYTYAATESAANDVSRQLATNRITQSQAQSAIPPRLPKWAQGAATVTVSASSSTPSANIYTVTTTIPMASATPSGVLKAFYDTRTLTVTVAMQQEPTS